MPDRIGQTLGNYRLIGHLGRGGFAEVYLGEHRRLGTQAAIKVLHAYVANEEEGDFLLEARTLAHLEHPNIIRILDFDVQDGTPFIVMGYAPNGTLRQRHPRGTILPLPTIIHYIAQIATSLQYAHDQRIIHRDIKPENMLLGRHQEILLSDFGIALLVQSSRLQSTQTVVGTAAYMAPEQLRGKPHIASDQYALGVVVYEWLSGERPFQGTFLEIYSQHLSVTPPLLASKNPAISPALDQVLQVALAKDPAQRFGSVKAFATALEQASTLRPAPPRNQPIPPVSETILPPSRVESVSLATPPQPIITGGDVSSAANSLKQQMPAIPVSKPNAQSLARQNTPVPALRQADGTFSTVLPATPKREVAPLMASAGRGISRRYILAGLTGLAALALVGGGAVWLYSSQQPPARPAQEGTILLTYRGHVDSVLGVAWSSTSKLIASASNDGTVQVWNANDGSSPYIYHGHANAVYAVAWSLDGTRIASASNDGTVQVWNANDGSSPYTYRGHTASVYAAAWSPDGTRIASASNDGTVQVWNASDGSSLYTYRGHTASVYAVAWSSDGTRIASASNDGTVQVWHASDGSSLYTYKGHIGGVIAVAWSPNGQYIASTGEDETVRVWNASDGSSPYIYNGHTAGVVNAVAWSPNGKWIASAGYDQTVQVWNANDGSSPYVYKGHTGAVNGVTWSHDGKKIASASSDKTVQVWDA